MADPAEDPIQVLALGTALIESDAANIDLHTWMADITDRVNFLLTLEGTGSPEGVIESSPRRWYVDTATGDIYYKPVSSGDGDTGWLLTT